MACRCSGCGGWSNTGAFCRECRLLRNMVDGLSRTDPGTYPDRIQDLMRVYNVTSLVDLVDEQDKHIVSLQKECRPSIDTKRIITVVIDKCPDCTHYGEGMGYSEDYCKYNGEEIVYKSSISPECPLINKAKRNP